MAVTFNGPLKVSRPGYTQDGITPNQGSVPNRQAWYAAVPVVAFTPFVGGTNASIVVPAGALIVGSRLLIDTAGTAAQTLNFNNGSTAVGAFGSVTTTTFTADATATSAAQALFWENIGTSDLAITLTGNTGTGPSGVWTLTYIPRNADGSLSDEGYRPFTQ